MDFIISLAHFCETHGPTTVLFTQLSPIGCHSCFPGPSTPPIETLSKNNSFSSENWDNNSPDVTPGTSGPLFSPFTSPPTSPRSPASGLNSYFGNTMGDNKPRRPSMTSEAEGDACEACDLVIPKAKFSGPKRGAESPSKSHKSRASSNTVLRSIHPIQAYGPGNGSETDEDDNEGRLHVPPSECGTSPTPSIISGVGSAGSHRRICNTNTHTHKLVYTTRHAPDSQSLYSRLRHSCIRTLSSESLPRGCSSGALSFGDPIAGYTIAYIFRLPDPRARGRRRNYALTALTRDNARAMAAFVPITKAFEAIASYIIAMTNRVLERDSAILGNDLLRTPPMSASAPMSDGMSPSSSVNRVKSSTSSPASASSKSTISDISSFLSAKRVDPDGYPRISREVMRAKGLPEIVGRDDFYPDLHIRFSGIINNLVTTLPR